MRGRVFAACIYLPAIVCNSYECAFTLYKDMKGCVMDSARRSSHKIAEIAVVVAVLYVCVCVYVFT